MGKLLMLVAIALVGLVFAIPMREGALAAGFGADAGTERGGTKGGGDSDLMKAAKDIDAQKYEEAISLLQKVIGRDARNADAWNLLGFSNRKIGKYADALGAYEKALAINPNHLGANEYLGELYVETGDLPKAEERLGRLNSLCPRGCDEARMLKAAIAAKKA